MLETTPMLADSDLFTLIIFVLFALLSGVSSWLQKRRENKEVSREAEWDEPDAEGVPQSPLAQEPEKSPLERELRRLLMGEKAAQQPAPETVDETISPSVTETEPTLLGADTGDHPARLETARQAYEKARHLGDAMAEHMAEVDARTEHPIATPVPTRRRANSAARAARSLLRHPHTARQAIVASVILASPPGLR